MSLTYKKWVVQASTADCGSRKLQSFWDHSVSDVPAVTGQVDVECSVYVPSHAVFSLALAHRPPGGDPGAPASDRPLVIVKPETSVFLDLEGTARKSRKAHGLTLEVKAGRAIRRYRAVKSVVVSIEVYKSPSTPEVGFKIANT